MSIENDVDLKHQYYGLGASLSDGNGKRQHLRRATLMGTAARGQSAETALFGRTRGNPAEDVFLNLADPFCLVALGVQGSGKSHTVATCVESCLMPFAAPEEKPLVVLAKPMAVLALHFGKSAKDACQLAGLFQPSPELATHYGHLRAARVEVLVSPSYYKQRVAYYKGSGAEVRPLLFRWTSLGAAHLRAIMRLEDEKNQQLYISVALDLLRRYQQKGVKPDFDDFAAEIEEACTSGTQSGPLAQRLQLLESVLAESKRNKGNGLAAQHADLADLVAPGTLVVADLTDPLLSAADANGIFQVLLEQFRASEVDTGKLVVLDEAHRYIAGSSGFENAVVDAVRVMRHEALRVVISTQSPLTLPPEILELASVAVLHGFHSSDWYAYLSSKLAIPKDGFATVRCLDPGDALVFAARSDLNPTEDFDDDYYDDGDDGRGCAVIRVRHRFTRDLGASRRSAR